MNKFSSLAAAAAVVVAIGCGGDRPYEKAEPGEPAASRTPPVPADRASADAAAAALSDAERQFVTKVAQDNRKEIALANMVEAKAEHDAVEDLAERIGDDHESALRTMQPLLGDDAVPAQMPTERLGSEAHELQSRLEKLSGKDLDRAYVKEMVEHHQHEIEEFEKQLARTTHPQLKSFIENTLTTLREHLEMARKAQQTIG